MARSYTDRTLKRLFSLAGNECSFPGCHEAIIATDGTVIGEICHICDYRSGCRYDSNQSDTERNDYNNLILLCPTHHKITGNSEKYSVEQMQRMKKDHEEDIEQRHVNYLLSAENLERVRCEVEKYWNYVGNCNKKKIEEFDLTMEINVKKHMRNYWQN